MNSEIKERIVKVCVMSDAHWNFPYIEVPDCDIFMYCGDWSGSGTISEHIKFCQWVNKINARYKLIVPGNHDMYCYHYPDMAASMLRGSNALLLVDKEVECYGIRIYGTPWSPRFGQWGYMRPDEDLYDYFKQIPKGVHILLTHTPPNGILDLAGTTHIGSKSLVRALKMKPIPFHFFGHNHTPGSFIKKIKGSFTRKYFNVSVCDDSYQVVVPPKEIAFRVKYEISENTLNTLEVQEL